MIHRNTTATHLPGDVFARPDFFIEADQSKQFNAALGNADPTDTADPILAMMPKVIRQDVNNDGVSEYVRFTGAEHTVLGGTEGNDTLIGGAGHDTVFGRAASDRLEGGVGNDKLYGGTGNDTLLGGDGNDLFVFKAADGVGSDLILDFKVGIDEIDARELGFTSIEAILAHAVANGASTIITADNGAVITLQNVNKDALTGHDFVF
jgi:Ca2+-binding RTX toxin-like protein